MTGGGFGGCTVTLLKQVDGNMVVMVVVMVLVMVAVVVAYLLVVWHRQHGQNQPGRCWSDFESAAALPACLRSCLPACLALPSKLPCSLGKLAELLSCRS